MSRPFPRVSFAKAQFFGFFAIVSLVVSLFTPVDPLTRSRVSNGRFQTVVLTSNRSTQMLPAASSATALLTLPPLNHNLPSSMPRKWNRWNRLLNRW
jgi:hypothetical protein